jgi:hypothetical protein
MPANSNPLNPGHPPHQVSACSSSPSTALVRHSLPKPRKQCIVIGFSQLGVGHYYPKKVSAKLLNKGIVQPVLELLKVLLPFLGGGAVGALLNEWFRRRRSKVQEIPLIERVNRSISPEVRGFALARVVGGVSDRKLEEVENCREYQLTVRNSSATHLNDAEIQFEFPTEDVQAWTSRPAISNTPLVRVDATATAPWKSAFRWAIPHFPSGDSVEFTFQAVNPPSDKFEAALYKTEGVVLKKIVGEPHPDSTLDFFDRAFKKLIVLFSSITFPIIIWLTVAEGLKNPSDKITVLTATKCELQVTSSSKPYDNGIYAFWWQAPAQIKYRLVNIGTGDCAIQSSTMLFVNPTMIKPGETIERESYSRGTPRLADVDISLGVDGPLPSKTTVPAYVKQ